MFPITAHFYFHGKSIAVLTPMFIAELPELSHDIIKNARHTPPYIPDSPYLHKRRVTIPILQMRRRSPGDLQEDPSAGGHQIQGRA